MSGDADGGAGEALLREIHRRRIAVEEPRPLLGGVVLALAGYASMAHAVPWIPPAAGADVGFLGLFLGGWLVVLGVTAAAAPPTATVAGALGAALGLASLPLTGGAGLLVPALAVAGGAACVAWWRHGPPLASRRGTLALVAAVGGAMAAGAVAVPLLGFAGLHVAAAVAATALAAVVLAGERRPPAAEEA